MNDIDLALMMESDSGAVTQTPEELGALAKMVNDMETAEAELERLTQLVEAETAKVAALKTKSIPELMSKIGVTSFKTASGAEVGVERKYYCGIAEDRRSAAMAWLEENGCSDIIKTDVVAPFTKGQAEEAAKLKALLSEQGISFISKESVHGGTLKAFVKRRMEAGQVGDEFMVLFSVHAPLEAKITRPKKKITREEL